MLPRTKSIFHAGEEGGEATKGTRAAIRGLECSKWACERLEGLRILIQHSGQRSNVVINSSLKSCMPHHHLSMASAPQFGFLQACFLCKKELSLHEDVYMYRGDQGFCSEECRGHQILLDERREIQVLSTRERLMKVPHRRRRAATTAAKAHESDRRRRRILAVA